VTIATPCETIVIIGAGHLAKHLASAVCRAGYRIQQIYSRTADNASLLAASVEAIATNHLEDISETSDFYFLCVPDAVVPEILKKIKITSGILLHTSGSLPMNVLSQASYEYGVIYPLQTFSKNADVDFNTVPLCIEASDPAALSKINALATLLCNAVYNIDSEKRRILHLAAVFCCNFVNRMYAEAYDMARKNNMDPHIFLPLIKETASKLDTLDPLAAQTGPALRHDAAVLEMHRDMLKNDSELLKLYNILTGRIQQNSRYEKL
jgi:predicted short-subunit dehydrogenase-like oxidoreductase (DUF2520 family)